MNKEQLIADLKAMSVLELAELVKALEDEFGVSAAAGAVVAAGPAAAAAEPVEEKTEVTEKVPASVLQLHPDVTVYMDYEAAKLL